MSYIKNKKDNLIRCSWAKNKIYIDYHDKYWNNKLTDEALLFELLILESQSVGLSFWQVWQKREQYNKYFDFKNPSNNLKIDENKINNLLIDSLLIKNKKKLLSIIENSKAYLKLINDYQSLSNFIWNNNNWKNDINKKYSQDITYNNTSIKITKILKSYGFKFLGKITIYSYLQAIGFYNSHSKNCFKYK